MEEEEKETKSGCQGCDGLRPAAKNHDIGAMSGNTVKIRQVMAKTHQLM